MLKKDTPYSVADMPTEDFIDWKKINTTMRKNYNINENEEKISCIEIKIITT